MTKAYSRPRHMNSSRGGCSPLGHLCELVSWIVSVLFSYVVQIVGFGRAVSGIVVGISGAIQRICSILVQYI